ncbi:hypothetical protein FQN57_007450 [Myotisia sp. PD_48]|nr:hypothetical protein FQN57_007450 [Myotisia sp. PD_48]
MARQSNVLAGKNDRPKPKPQNSRRKVNGLNAFATAEKLYPTDSKIRKHRLGVEEDDSDAERAKRSKRARNDDEQSDEEVGGDSDGNEWQIGEVNTDNDSEIDSDEAMNSSDEERFEGYTFRASSTHKINKAGSKHKSKTDAKVSGDEDENLLDEEEFNGVSQDEEVDDDDLGEDAVDLATAWDMNEQEDAEGGERTKTKANGRKDAHSDDDSISGDSESEEEDDEEDDDASSDASGLSMSDIEDRENKHGLTKLQRFVKSLEHDELGANKSSSKPKSALSGRDPTEFGVNPGRKLTVADLLPSISNSQLKGALKHLENDSLSTKNKSSSMPGKLSAPLAKRQQDRIDREVAYEKSKETLNRWIDTVKHNRRAEHLSFPLPEPGAPQPSKVVESNKLTDLESAIQNILVESGLADSKDGTGEDKIREFEEIEEKKLSVEEVQARRSELRKQRELLFREEIRARRINKIKSKAYRRVHRKEREKMANMEREALAAAGVDPDEEDRERADRIRAEARMSSKHKESKWAKSLKQTGRATWDENARIEMNELVRREEELQKRVEGKKVVKEDDEYLETSSSSSEDEEEEDGADVEEKRMNRKLDSLASNQDDQLEDGGQYSKLFSMKFMQNAEAGRKAANDREIKQLRRDINDDGSASEVDIQEEFGRQKFGKKDTKTTNKQPINPTLREFEEPEDREDLVNQSNSDKEVEIRPQQQQQQHPRGKHNKPLSQAKTYPVTEEQENEEANPWLSENTKKHKRKKEVPNPASEISVIDNNPSAPQDKPKSKNSSQNDKIAYESNDEDDKGEGEGEDSMPVLLRNDELIKQAFAGDEVLATFNQEKKEIVEEEDDKVVDTTLPGWGSWTGSGLSKAEKRQVKTSTKLVKGLAADQRKDAKLDRVIINEKRIKKNNKYLASQLPHPFESRQQYERSLRMPIGPEWTTKSTFQSATKPRVMVKQGVIKPIRKPMM